MSRRDAKHGRKHHRGPVVAWRVRIAFDDGEKVVAVRRMERGEAVAEARHRFQCAVELLGPLDEVEYRAFLRRRRR